MCGSVFFVVVLLLLCVCLLSNCTVANCLLRSPSTPARPSLPGLPILKTRLPTQSDPVPALSAPLAEECSESHLSRDRCWSASIGFVT